MRGGGSRVKESCASRIALLLPAATDVSRVDCYGNKHLGYPHCRHHDIIVIKSLKLSSPLLMIQLRLSRPGHAQVAST